MSYSFSRLAPRRGTALAAALLVSAGLALTGGLLAASSAGAATLPTLSIAITSSSATVTGPLESGGVNVAVTDAGVKEGAVILGLLKPGVTLAEAETFQKEKKAKHDINNVNKIGSVVADTEANPGATSEFQVKLEPGTYIVLVAQGEKGEAAIRASFKVTTAKAPVALPAPQATERAIDFGFTGPSTLKDGEVVGFENEGFVVHMNVAFPVKNLKAAKKAVKLLKAGNEKAIGKLIAGPPVLFTGPVSSGAYQQETITAKPGIYVEVCFMNAQDGHSHTVLGMQRIIKITK
jgi:uncharacterized cupredoxin-like copper-binding protein